MTYCTYTRNRLTTIATVYNLYGMQMQIQTLLIYLVATFNAFILVTLVLLTRTTLGQFISKSSAMLNLAVLKPATFNHVLIVYKAVTVVPHWK